ncbi:Uncharacterized protein HZ326_24722 [Fusarium oxysporum f. sp. albedinis]|nr:Uncharacterized protein HZ326_24722 [Fusarium oxysporum f. sp. albedinis]
MGCYSFALKVAVGLVSAFYLHFLGLKVTPGRKSNNQDIVERLIIQARSALASQSLGRSGRSRFMPAPAKKASFDLIPTPHKGLLPCSKPRASSPVPHAKKMIFILHISSECKAPSTRHQLRYERCIKYFPYRQDPDSKSISKDVVCDPVMAILRCWRQRTRSIMNYHDGVAGSKEWFQRLSELSTRATQQVQQLLPPFSSGRLSNMPFAHTSRLLSSEQSISSVLIGSHLLLKTSLARFRTGISLE